MKYLSDSADEIAAQIVASSKAVGETDVISCAEVTKKLVKLLLNKGLTLVRCNISDDDNWYYINIVDDEMEVGVFQSTSSADVVYFQYDIDDEYVSRISAEIILFELRYGIE